MDETQTPPTPDVAPAIEAEPLGIIELLMRVGGSQLRAQDLAKSLTDVRTKRGGVSLTFVTDQIAAADLVHLADRPWSQLPRAGLIMWMPTVSMQAAIRAHIAATTTPSPVQ